MSYVSIACVILFIVGFALGLGEYLCEGEERKRYGEREEGEREEGEKGN
jgi:hypothetical protein